MQLDQSPRLVVAHRDEVTHAEKWGNAIKGAVKKNVVVQGHEDHSIEPPEGLPDQEVIVIGAARPFDADATEKVLEVEWDRVSHSLIELVTGVSIRLPKKVLKTSGVISHCLTNLGSRPVKDRILLEDHVEPRIEQFAS